MRTVFLIAVAWMLAGQWLTASPLMEPMQQGAAERRNLEQGARYVQVGGGVSFGTRQFGGDVTHDLATIQVQYGVVVSDHLAQDRFWGGRLLLAGDFLYGHQFHPENAYLFGATPLVRYVVETEGRLKPFVEGGVGFALTDIGEPRLGGKFQFSPQVGAGLYWFLNPNLAVAAQNRFIHYSNGGIRTPNGGINQYVILLGVARFY